MVLGSADDRYEPVLISTRQRVRYAAVLRILSSSRGMTFCMVGETAKLAARPATMVTLLTRLINAHSEYQWLDQDTGVYWHVPRGRPRRGNKILYQCRKLFSLSRRLHLDEIYRGVQRTRTVARLPARHVLLEMLRQTKWFLINGNYVQLRDGIQFDELSTGDRRLVRAVTGLGSTVTFLELRDNLVREGITSTHAGQHIKFCPFLYRVSRGRYRVLFDAEDLSIAKLSSTECSHQDLKDARTDRVVTMETTSGGDRSRNAVEPSVVVQLSSRALITDRIFVDSELPSGQWEVVDTGGCRVGHCKTSRGAIYELPTALQCVGARVGDFCRLRFDRDSKRVEIQGVVG